MASKNTDIIEQLADTIVANLTTPVAKRGKETAPNDKSFYATILGVNQKFVDTISTDDQATLIEKFSLPETVEDGENSYYIFKINGAYYCKSQNGDFKLYDDIMVYVPNGDWSRMYIDYPIYIKEDTHIPMPFVSETEPEEGMVEGDYWDKVDSNGDILAVYIYQPNEITGDLEWSQLFSVATSDGVGENIGRHNERHNKYGDFDEDWANGMDTASYNQGSDYCSFRNYQSRVINSYVYAADISGYDNRLTNGSGLALDLGGQANRATGNCRAAFIRGNGNTVTGQYSATFGDANTVNNVSGKQLTGGDHNTVTSESSLTFGRYNTNDVDYAIAGGAYADTDGQYILAIGSAQRTRNILTLDRYGTLTADTYATYGADYGEYFEWCDGNSGGEDRMGLLVEQIGDKIAPAQGTEFFGAISARASVVGNAYESYWHGKYLTDVYGRMLTDENGAAIISPEFDPGREYVPRSERPEWDVVGIVGRIIIRDDGSCKPGGYVSARRGIATFCDSKTPAKVLRRIDDTHIEVLIK